MEYCSPINKRLIDATIWMNLKNIMISKRIQTQHIFYEFVYMESPEKPNVERQKWLPKAEGKVKTDYKLSYTNLST